MTPEKKPVDDKKHIKINDKDKDKDKNKDKQVERTTKPVGADQHARKTGAPKR